MSSISPQALIVGAATGEPARHLFLVTPNDAIELLYVTRAIRVGSAGDLAVKTVGGEVIVIPSCLAGEYVPAQVVKVYSTATTAGMLMGMA